MQLTSSLASKLYLTAQGALKPGAPVQPQPETPSAGQTFMKTAASFVEALRKGEQTAIAGMAGRADPQSVVTALASAEMAVQTAVTVRDKVVEAYQEILRMPV
ncbi:MAG: flagellar hook-basal body complex protein FliE [Pseudomonadota bacterium]